MRESDFRPTRRVVFHGLSAIGVAVALAGCAGADDDSGSEPPGSGTPLASLDEVPVGGGLILRDQKVVITQVTEGVFTAYSAVCTHAGNTVTSVEGGLILCSFHGSSYSAETGAVEDGPAPSALAEVAITVEGDQILAA